VLATGSYGTVGQRGPLARAATGIRLLFFGRHPGESRFPQANWITFAKFCRCNNPLGDNIAHDFRLAGVVKFVECSLVSFTHRRNGLRSDRVKFHGWENEHRHVSRSFFLV